MFSNIMLLFVVSQLYWGWRGFVFLSKRIHRQVPRLLAAAAIGVIYVTLYNLNMGSSGRARATPIYLTPREAFLHAPYLWWAASSFFAFLVVVLFAIPRGIVAAVRRIRASLRRPDTPANPSRRDFLARTASVASAAPFVAGTYGLFYGRLNLETTNPTIKLAKLPRAFEGFRIAQLSDIHIGPYMPAEEIRKYAAICAAQKPDMIVLTGDFVTFDPATERPVVEALSSLRAPYGVFGCLGNHDMWSGVEDSIADLFRRAGIRMLRGEAVPIVSGADSFSLLGVDFQSPRRFGPSPAVRRILGNIEGLIDPNRVNVLLSHNPDTFDRAAELNIDLSLAGHTHGGQVSLEFIDPNIAPSRLVTPYVAGWFQKPGGQLYVNRGIGTIFIPMRVGAPPELTVYSLSRA
jgi:predicted MPP superfamily phosphohydrolase